MFLYTYDDFRQQFELLGLIDSYAHNDSRCYHLSYRGKLLERLHP